jgi:hypothetical protein
MNLKRPNKKLELEIKKVVQRMRCPIHNKEASVSMDNEEAEVQVEACCVFFKKDVMVVGERMRKDFLYKDQKTRERLDREWKKANRPKDDDDIA